jgi:hypothetical protein
MILFYFWFMPTSCARDCCRHAGILFFRGCHFSLFTRGCILIRLTYLFSSCYMKICVFLKFHFIIILDNVILIPGFQLQTCYTRKLQTPSLVSCKHDGIRPGIWHTWWYNILSIEIHAMRWRLMCDRGQATRSAWVLQRLWTERQRSCTFRIR